MKKMRKTLSLILSLVLAFSLAAVPAFAADATEAETSTSDTAYGQLHNGLLSEILSRIDIANDDNFIHGIVNVDEGDLFKDIASNNHYMHGIITITGNTVNINFGQVIGDIAAGGANSEAAQQALAEILKAFGMTQTGINAILTGFAGSILTNDQIAQLQERAAFYTNTRVDETHQAVRFVTSWATTDAQVDALLALLNEVLG